MHPSVILCQFTEVSTLIAAIINLDNHILEQVEENPYLGATIHKNLRWASHINKILNKANSVLGFMQCNVKHANRDIKELAYASLVWSILEYSSEFCDPFYRKDRNKKNCTVTKCQNYA